jgi:hypothetical protein
MVLYEGGPHIESQGMFAQLPQEVGTVSVSRAVEQPHSELPTVSMSEMMLHGVVLRGPDLLDAQLR